MWLGTGQIMLHEPHNYQQEMKKKIAGWHYPEHGDFTTHFPVFKLILFFYTVWLWIKSEIMFIYYAILSCFLQISQGNPAEYRHAIQKEGESSFMCSVCFKSWPSLVEFNIHVCMVESLLQPANVVIITAPHAPTASASVQTSDLPSHQGVYCCCFCQLWTMLWTVCSLNL